MDETAGLVSSSWLEVKKETDTRPYHRIERPPRKGFFTRRKSIRRPKVQRLGSKGRKRWGLRMPKIKIRISSPLSWLAKLRDAYVKFMMKLANSGSGVGMAIGPSVWGVPVLNGPQKPRLVISGNRVVDIGALSEVELMYLEYLKRDPTFSKPGYLNPFF